MSSISGAPESSAGDDFHVLWAARRLLTLLEPHSKLTALKVEGVNPDESILLDPDGDQLLGIDITEYYGGLDSNEASRVVFSQLKYSTRRSDLSWTAARIVSDSIVHRLRQVFDTYKAHLESDAFISKVTLALVSNRPCDSGLIGALSEAKNLLQHKNIRQRARLLKSLSDEHRSEIKRISDACPSMSSGDFCVFIQVLDLTQCGTYCRLHQALELKRALAELEFDELSLQYSHLKELVNREMHPEARNTRPLEANDVLLHLDLGGGVHSIFPCPSSLEQVDNSVRREQIDLLAQTIIESEGKPICIHGGAGCGKSILCSQLSDALPSGSTVIQFDCYGGGSYLDPSEERHSHERAIAQIANDVAVRTGAPLFLSQSKSKSDLLRMLKRRLEYAIRVLRSESPEALLLIAIDAADNSITAAEKRDEVSFVPDLARLAMPEGVRLVLTSRTHRVDALNLPDNAAKESLNPFTEGETCLNLQRHIDDLPDEFVAEFHNLSGGVPRVQGYALNRSFDDPEEVLNLLRPGGKTVTLLFDEMIQNAINQFGNDSQVSCICEALVALPRPIPTNYVGMISEISSEAVSDLVTDLFQGLILNEGIIHFRDEDFEDYLQSKYPPGSTLCARLADLLMERRDEDQYAAENVAEALSRVGRTQDVINLILTDKLPSSIADPVIRHEVFARRARVAMNAAVDSDDLQILLRLLYVAAEAAKVDRVVEDLLIEHCDLAVRYGDYRTVQRLYLNQSRKGRDWAGREHMSCAANYARQSESRNQAIKHLDLARAWLRKWLSEKEDNSFNSPFQAEDIACMAEAIHRLYGPHRALDWISTWQPRSFVFSVKRKYFRRLLLADGPSALDNIPIDRLGVVSLLALSREASDYWHLMPDAAIPLVNHLFKHVKWMMPNLDEDSRKGVVSLVELVVARIPDAGKYTEELDTYFPCINQNSFAAYSKETICEYVAFLRGKVLLAALRNEALAPDDKALLPDRYQTPPESDNWEEKNDWEKAVNSIKSLYRQMLPVLTLRADVLLGHFEPADIKQRFSDVKLNSGDVSYMESHLRYSGRHIRHLQTLAFADAATRVPEITTEVFEKVCVACVGEQNNTLDFDLCLEIAERACHISALQGHASRLIGVVANRLEEEPYSGSETLELLIRCAHIADAFDKELGRVYFDKAVSAATELDEEAVPMLLANSHLAECASPENSSLADPNMASNFASVIEACYHRVADLGEFPWRDCIDALVSLSPQVAVSAVLRWNQRGLLECTDELGPLVRKLFERSAICPTMAVACQVLTLSNSEGAMRTALAGIDGISDIAIKTGAVELVGDVAMRLAPRVDCGNLSNQLLEYLKQHAHLSPRLTRELQEIVDFSEGIEATTNKHSHYTTGMKPDTSNEQAPIDVDWSQILRDGRCSEVEDLKAAFTRLDSVLETSSNKWRDGPVLREELLGRILSEVRPAQYVNQLDALVELPSSVLNFDEFVCALEKRREAWSTNPRVTQWFAGLPKKLTQRRFDDFFYYDSFGNRHIEKLHSILEVDKAELVRELVAEAPSKLRNLSERPLYGLCMALQSSMRNRNDCANVLQLNLDDLSTRHVQPGLAVDGLAECHSSSGESSEYPVEVPLLGALLGHPDKRVRWLAAHTTRRMFYLGNDGLLSELLEWINRATPSSLMPNTTFYRFAAKQWFFYVANRLVQEQPSRLMPLASGLRNEILQPNEPHVFIMQLAKDVAIALSQAVPEAFDVETLTQIQASLTPILPEEEASADSADSKHRNDYRQARGNGRFNFDSTDTLPYWYAPAGELFDMEDKSFLVAAENWICDKWDLTYQLSGMDPVRKWMVSDHNWQLRSNGHGSKPTIEDLHTYAELNAMACVVGEFINTMPLVQQSWGTPLESWESWLRRWNVACIDSKWLADCRQMTPLETSLWDSESLEVSSGETKEPTDLEFDKAAALLDSPHSDFLLTEADVTRRHYSGSESIRVSTALVSESTASSLLKALADSYIDSDYRIPDEGDELEFDCTLEDSNFLLKGWIKSDYSEGNGGFGSKDPLNHHIQSGPAIPGEQLRSYLGLIKDERGAGWIRPGASEPIAFTQWWNDHPDEEARSSLASEGRRLWIKRSEVFGFLRAEGWAIITKCCIERNPKRNHHTSRYKDEYRRRTMLYVTYSDGRIERLRSRVFTWPEDH